MSQSGAKVGMVSHKCGKYGSEWSRCEKRRSHGGARVRSMSHECGKYESDWSRCEKRKESM